MNKQIKTILFILWLLLGFKVVRVYAQPRPIIDVLVVYTAAAANTSPNIINEINLAISETNTSYQNSGINQRLRLVHAAQINYVEDGNMSRDLGKLRNATDGYMDDVHQLRNTYNADMVSLWVEGGGYCGIAYLMSWVSPKSEKYAFSVVKRLCATGYYSFGHELGHNMSATHDWDVSSSTTPYEHMHGYVDAPGQWRTIMSYNSSKCYQDYGKGCVRLPYWANPDVDYKGSPMGVPVGSYHPADNRLTLNKTARVVSNFRTGTGGGCVPSEEICDGIDNDCDGKTDEGILLCNDGLWCNGTETCNGRNGCKSGTPPDCSDLAGVCNVGACNENTDTCESNPANNGDPCGNQTDTACTNPDTCDGAGTCQENHLPAGTVCRPISQNCDIEETCTGLSALCPEDNDNCGKKCSPEKIIQGAIDLIDQAVVLLEKDMPDYDGAKALLERSIAKEKQAIKEIKECYPGCDVRKITTSIKFEKLTIKKYLNNKRSAGSAIQKINIATEKLMEFDIERCQ